MFGLRVPSTSVPKRLWRARDGATGMLFSLAIIPVVAAVGLAIDYGQALRVKTQLKSALDAATLAGMNAQTAGVDPTSTVNSFLAAHLATTGLTPTVTVTPNVAQGTLSTSASLPVATSFMGVLGMPTVPVTVSSMVAAGTGGNPFEVAIAFDTTGSMAGTKLSSAQTAANQLITTLFTVPGSSLPNPNVKIGLVPFSDYVNVGTQYSGAPWLTNSADYSTSTYACWNTYPNAVYSNPVTVPATCTSDGIPYSCPYTSYTVDYGAPVQVCGNQSTNYTWNGCVGSQSATNDTMDAADSSNQVPALLNYYCPAPLIRLTNTPTVLQNAVNAMTASGETYIAPGLLWAWRLLTPNADSPFADGAPYGAAKKVLILMTDGANTHSPQYPVGDHEGTDVTAANAKVLQTCQNIKATGIQIFTIVFDVTDPTIQTVLSQCSSGPPYYYNASTIADLQGAFQMIGSQLTSIRVVQ